MWTGLKSLNEAIAVVKILNLKVSPREKNNENVLKSRWFRKLGKDLKQEDIDININSDNQVTIFHFFNSYVVSEETKARDLYEFQTTSLINISCLPNVGKSAFYQNTDSKNLEAFIKKLWNYKKLQSFVKKFLYLFVMHSYLDKQQKWLKNIVPHSVFLL